MPTKHVSKSEKNMLVLYKVYFRIREMHTRLPGKRGDENRKDYGRGRRESN